MKLINFLSHKNHYIMEESTANNTASTTTSTKTFEKNKKMSKSKSFTRKFFQNSKKGKMNLSCACDGTGGSSNEPITDQGIKQDNCPLKEENNNHADRRAVKSLIVSKKDYDNMLHNEKGHIEQRPRTKTNDGTMTPHAMLFYAVQYKEFNLLETVMLENPDLDINALNEDGIALFHFAAMVGTTESIEILKSHGGNLNLEDIRGNPPLHYAWSMKNYDFAGSLIQSGATNKALIKQYKKMTKRITWHNS